MTIDDKRNVIETLFICMIPTAVLVASKITTVMGFSFSVGAYAYAITFPCTDIIGECFGKSRANRLVLLGLLGYACCVLFSLLAVHSPAAPFWQGNQAGYEATLGLVPRIVLASMLAYLVSQIHDIWAFHFWKRITSGSHLWLRNNVSTLSSQLIDSLIFVLIAFAGVVPRDEIAVMILGQYLIKVVIAALDTPVVYLGVRWIRGHALDQSGKEFARATL